MKTLSSLKPLPIEFNEKQHSYRWLPTGQRLRFGVTSVLRVRKTEKALCSINKTKHIWGPRGTHVHWCLEQFLKGTPKEDLLGGEYDQWVKPLLNYPTWQEFEPIALEYRVCDLKKNIGGSLDVLGYDHANGGKLVLMDLKTQGKEKITPYCTDAQLGGYASMLISHHRLKIDECVTMWSGKGRTMLGGVQPVDRCLEDWDLAYSLWRRLNPPL